MTEGIDSAYLLLSEIYARGYVLSEDLAQHVDVFSEFVVRGSAEKKERLAERHHQILQLDVYPTAGTFLSGYRGDDLSSQHDLFAAYRAINFESDASLPGDHLSSLFSCLAEANRQGSQQISRKILARHVLSWLPGFQIAIQDSPGQLYEELTSTALEICNANFEELSRDNPGCSDHQPLPIVEKLEDSSGVRELADHLSAHASSGLYFSKSALTRIARSLDLPTGFGPRRQLLSNILRASVEFEKTDELIAELDLKAQEWQKHYGSSSHASAVANSQRDWPLRISATRKIFSDIRTQLSAPTVDG